MFPYIKCSIFLGHNPYLLVHTYTVILYTLKFIKNSDLFIRWSLHVKNSNLYVFLLDERQNFINIYALFCFY